MVSSSAAAVEASCQRRTERKDVDIALSDAPIHHRPLNSFESIPPRHPPNPYANLVPAKKRKQSEAMPDPPMEGLSISANEGEPGFAMSENENSARPGKRGYTVRKKAPVKTAKPEYVSVDVINRRTAIPVSEWYQNIDTNKSPPRSELIMLRNCGDLIRKSRSGIDGGLDVSAELSQLRQRLSQMPFFSFLHLIVAGVLIKKSGILEESGLPRAFATDDKFPWDIRDDSLALYNRWMEGDYSPDLLRGITSRVRIKTGGDKSRSNSLEQNYRFKVRCDYAGEGALVNGQWWPLQICLIRDGCHGETEGGISGKKADGAYSIVLSHGGYADIDNGDTIEYCGTSGENGKATANTELMRSSYAKKIPIRVVRSSKLPAANPYRPEKGFRYDGLYHIESEHLLDQAAAMYRFRLVRIEGQNPIRWRGIEKRPTSEETKEYERTRELMGFAA